MAYNTVSYRFTRTTNGSRRTVWEVEYNGRAATLHSRIGVITWLMAMPNYCSYDEARALLKNAKPWAMRQ